MKRSFYEMLDVPRQATQEQIDAAFHAALIEGAEGNGRDAGLGRNVFAELHVVAVEAERAEIDADEIRALRLHDAEADVLEALGKAIPLLLQIARQAREIGVVLSKAIGDGLL